MKKLKILIIIPLIFFIISCSSSQTPYSPIMRRSINVDPCDLHQLENIREQTTAREGNCAGSGGGGLSSIRTKALEDTALSLAAQGSLACASKKINCQLEKDRWYLETIFNFNGMMLTHGIIPPVLEEGNFTLNLADPTTIRVADKTYKIIKQARFATTPPNWREYLWMTYSEPEIPNVVLLPTTAEESRVWKKAIQNGWAMGEKQATSIFQQNLARLKRDYAGMILYRKLLEQHMISAPFVSRTELGVTGDGSDMNINDQVLRITELPQLQTDTKCWKAIMVKNEG